MDTMTAGLGVLTGADVAPEHLDPPSAAALAGVGLVSELYMLGGLIANPALAYHGYKRNDDSLAWGIGWWLTPIPWPIQGVFAYAQGYAKLDKRLAGRQQYAALPPGPQYQMQGPYR
jgi:hypothetical protein